MKKITTFFLLFLFLSIAPHALAADLNIDCPAPPTECLKTGDLLFDNTKDGLWYPGRVLTKTINLKNSSLEKRVMAIKGKRVPSESNLEEVMRISILGGTEIWSGSVADFYNQDKIEMGIFDPWADFDYDFRVSMSPDADDKYQNKGMIFNLTLGFWGEPIPTPTPTSVPPTTAPGDMVLGTSASAPVCNDTKPRVPTNFTASVGPEAGQVSLSWTPPDPPYTYFLVAYGDNSDWPPKWGNPDMGNVTSYTVSGLGGGTFWFWLRAGNGCMPGDFVGPISPGAIAGLGTGGPAVGFVEGVLGAKKEEPEGEVGGGIATTAGEVGGAKAPICPFWWIALAGQTLLLTVFYLLAGKVKGLVGFKWPATAAIVGLGFLLDRYTHTHWYLPSRVCSYEIWLGGALAILQWRILPFPKRIASHRVKVS
jgi:hypothetical protein